MFLLLLNVIVVPIVLLGITYLLSRFGKKKPKKFNPKQKNKWLIAHILFIIIYFGGLLGTLLLALSTKFTDDRELIYAAHLYMQFFDWFFIIPGGMGSFITGIWLAVRTHWGITRHYWVLTKWIGNLAAILFGASFMRVWLHDNFAAMFSNPVHPLRNPFYLSNRVMIFIGLGISFSILIFLVIISYFKPWGKRKGREEVQP